jgi:ABC-type bacteriocin/lantibiotic exporter with double-glycine peptidase domain
MSGWLAGIAVMATFPSVAETTVDTSRLVSECGVASVYALLRLSGKAVSLEEVENRFRALRPGIDLGKLSMADLREVSRSFGMRVASFRVDPSDISNIPVPAILYLRPEKLAVRGVKPPIGHFILLRSVNNAHAEVMDFTFPGGRGEVPLDRLSQGWDGEMLALATGAPDGHHLLVSAILVGGTGGLVLGWLFRRR